jgi:transcriptional regulator with GAF, ATPase, and Fis domain
MRRVLAQIEQVAGTDATVLVLGETGVGKELVARAVHRTGGRSGMPFISVQLSMISEHLIPSELLGHERGAFTGATQRRIGRFELADSGTLFLDEIGDISPEIQVCLLRVLQTRQFERVGGTGTITSDFRLIAATNRDLEKEMTDGRFRPDLFYRLNVFPIHVPPLRERREDIPLLANHFLRIFSTKMGKTFEAFPEEEMRKLMNYDWPGNVRELQNLMERGTILGQGPLFHVPALGLSPGDSAPTGRNLTLADNERRHILRVLAQTGWRVAGRGGAAEILDIPPSTLAFRMKKLGITRPQPRWYQRGSKTI